jgi:hypothetical protein
VLDSNELQSLFNLADFRGEIRYWQRFVRLSVKRNYSFKDIDSGFFALKYVPMGEKRFAKKFVPFLIGSPIIN